MSFDKFDFSGKRALIRVDFNVPLSNDLKITDNTRMQASIPTIKHILDAGGKVILMSHMGRPKGEPVKEFSLQNVVGELENLTGTNVYFADDCLGDNAEKQSKELKAGEILLLENLRFYEGEKAGSEEMAEKLARLGDVYVNDAFGTAHRAHASTAVIAKFFKGRALFGKLMGKELGSVAALTDNPQKPFTAVIGGAKVSSKIGIIENLLDKLDNLIIGGGMVYTFIKAEGGRVGDSLVEEAYIETAGKVLKAADKKNVRVLLPEDTVAANKFSNDAEKSVVDTNDIPDGLMGLDIGPRAMGHYKLCIEESKSILWNGPMGVFEFDNFSEGTMSVAYAIVNATERGAFSLVGGGDSVAAVNKFKIKDHVSYVSTGGGALLELIQGKELPGIKAVREAGG